MKANVCFGIVVAAAVVFAGNVYSFCGFYVAKADAKLFNKASRVVLVRDEDRTVLTMVNDYQGDPKAFAVVIPVPTVLERGQIHVGDQAIVDHLDAYTAPRLVEYFDDDPCKPVAVYEAMKSMARADASSVGPRRSAALGVTVEAEYTVGEYDIAILSATESDGLQTWLTESGYKIPAGAGAILQSYIRQGLRFFVARVNLDQQSRLGFTFLRPLQIAYESPRFMLPIRLGTINASGPQDLLVYALSRKGRIETTNYRTVKLPTGMDLPVYVKGDFADFYRDMFAYQVKKEDMRVVFLEYAWDMNWCDPCAADPLTPRELRDLGVFWLDDPRDRPGARKTTRGGQAQDVFVTRLHVRYDAETFPEDLVFQETGDRTNFQGRYVIRHPWTGDTNCDRGRTYRRDLRDRQEQEARQLANLTGWDIGTIRERMNLEAPRDDGGGSWWDQLWND